MPHRALGSAAWLMEIWVITVIAMLAGAFGSLIQKRGPEINAQA